MRVAIAAALATTVVLLAASMLGVASAEAPTATPARTVSVQGVAMVPIAQDANFSAATAVYRQGMAAAVSDGQAKAEFLAGKAGATLGAVQSIAEDGGYIGCIGGEESNGIEYQGEQPDFGSADVSVSPVRVNAGVAAPAKPPVLHRPAVKKRGKPGKGPTAKRASAPSCTLNAQVTLLYTLG
jgi:uncharacterized protein DUF541